MKRSIFFSLLFMFSQSVAAEDAWRTNPTSFINHFAEVGIDDILSANINEADKTERFRNLFNEGFDIPAIGRFVLARNWRRANDTEKQAFIALFEDLIVYTWSRRFSIYDGQTIDVRGTTPDGETGTLVDSAIVDSNGESVSVQWRLRKREEGLRIVDVIVEGVSMAITYRQEYASVIRQRGGLNGLLAMLKQQVSALENS
ncbi:MAG: ABC transporter substrate-binding protein [Rhodospirillaceae bacterium]|nr:ABC transporter substrate-binding protein [Rhodospirillaceae bacterium]